VDWLAAPDYWLTRFVFERALGTIYLIAFLVTVNQFRPLLGEHGLLPAPDLIRAVPFRASPSLFHLVGYSDRKLLIVGWAGVVLSVIAVTGAGATSRVSITTTRHSRCPIRSAGTSIGSPSASIGSRCSEITSRSSLCPGFSSSRSRSRLSLGS